MEITKKDKELAVQLIKGMVEDLGYSRVTVKDIEGLKTLRYLNSMRLLVRGYKGDTLKSDGMMELESDSKISYNIDKITFKCTEIEFKDKANVNWGSEDLEELCIGLLSSAYAGGVLKELKMLDTNGYVKSGVDYSNGKVTEELSNEYKELFIKKAISVEMKDDNVCEVCGCSTEILLKQTISKKVQRIIVPVGGGIKDIMNEVNLNNGGCVVCGCDSDFVRLNRTDNAQKVITELKRYLALRGIYEEKVEQGQALEFAIMDVNEGEKGFEKDGIYYKGVGVESGLEGLEELNTYQAYARRYGITRVYMEDLSKQSKVETID